MQYLHSNKINLMISCTSNNGNKYKSEKEGAGKCTCKWLATFSLVSPSTFITSRIFFGNASAKERRINENKTKR